MKDIIRQLYDGEIYPAEDIRPTDPQYFIAGDKLHKEMEILKQRLSPEDLERLERMRDYQGDMCDIDAFDSFKHGFTLGALIMCELLMDGNNKSRK